MKEIKIYKSRGKAIKFLLLSLVFVTGGIFLIGKPDVSQFMAWLVTLSSGLGIPIFLLQLFDRRPQIIINEIGIFDRTTHKDFINWEIIRDAYLMKVHGQPFICLVVPQEFEPSRKKGKLAKGMAKVNKSLGFQELNISLGPLNINAKRLTEFVLAMRSAEKVNRANVLMAGV